MIFLGLTEAEAAPGIVARDASRLRFAAAGGLAAICATRQAPSLWRGRGRPPDAELDVRRLLALAAGEGPFVAAAPGAEASGPGEALDALGGDLAPFAAALARFGYRREFRIGVTWDARATLRGFAERDAPELALARSGGCNRFGAAIAEAMAAERRRLGQAARAWLHGASEDMLTLPARDDDQIVNVVAMIGCDGRRPLDAALARIAAALPGEPIVRCVGPLPAVSFAAVALGRADTVDFATGVPLRGRARGGRFDTSGVRVGVLDMRDTDAVATIRLDGALRLGLIAQPRAPAARAVV